MLLKHFNRMKARFLLLLIPLMVLTPRVMQAQSSAPTDSDLAKQIDAMLTTVFPDDGPGAAVLVLRDGEIILRQGYGLAVVGRGPERRGIAVFGALAESARLESSCARKGVR
ncbi:MAG: hypothetical protein R3A44_23255 [Caldilineaceae bacterium]